MSKPTQVIRYQGKVLFYVRTVQAPGTTFVRHEYNSTGKAGSEVPVMFFEEDCNYESLDESIATDPTLLDKLRKEAARKPDVVPYHKRGPHRLSNEKIASIRAMRSAGATFNEIQKKLGVAPMTIRKYTLDIVRPVSVPAAPRIMRKSKRTKTRDERSAELEEIIKIHKKLRLRRKVTPFGGGA